MKTTIKQIIESNEALNTLITSKQPVKVAWRIARILRLLEPELKAYEEARMKVITQYAEVEGDRYTVPVENGAAFNDAMQALISEEISLAAEPIAINSLDGNISAQDIATLEWVLVE